jgi:hypothetical protein
MRLQAWSSAWRDIDFDPATGSASAIRLPGARPDSAPLCGFAQFERRVFGAREVFALYRSGDALFFSAGARRWKLGDPGLRFTHGHRGPFMSNFRVVESEGVGYSLLYPHVGRTVYAIVDPTYDGIDRDSDFFLAFVAENAQKTEWQENIRERWSSGQ